jgi:hypothetical protein
LILTDRIDKESGLRSIDIHAHITPQCFWTTTDAGRDWHTLRCEQDARGRQYAVVGGRRRQRPPKARWTPEERLADMGSLGVDVHVLSPTPGFTIKEAILWKNLERLLRL